MAFEKAEGKRLGQKLRRTVKLLGNIAEGLPDRTPSQDRRWRWTLDARIANRAPSKSQ